MARIALTCYRRTPLLARCPPASVFAGVVILAQQGLEPGLNGRAFLVPYKNRKTGEYECNAVPGWKGLVELANRTGRCSVWTGAVFAGDEFDYQLGDNPFVTHKPGSEDDPEKLRFVYSIGRVKGNEFPVVEVWSNDKVRKHFKRYNKVGDAHYAFGNWEMYARKVPLLQVLKYMPSSPELEAAIAMSYAADRGSQELNIKDAIEGTFAPPTIEDDEAGGDSTEASGGNEGVKEMLAKKAGKAKAATEAPSEAKVPRERLVASKLRAAAAKRDVDLLDAHATLIIDEPVEAQPELKALYQELRSALVPS
jgi:recombination protein RecT